MVHIKGFVNSINRRTEKIINNEMGELKLQILDNLQETLALQIHSKSNTITLDPFSNSIILLKLSKCYVTNVFHIYHKFENVFI